MEGIDGDNFNMVVSRKLGLKDWNETGVNFKSINLLRVSRQGGSKASIPRPDFYHNVIRLEFRGFYNPLEHAGIDDEMLPQPLLRPNPQIFELSAERIQLCSVSFPLPEKTA
jgi:hypothetical protein